MIFFIHLRFRKERKIKSGPTKTCSACGAQSHTRCSACSKCGKPFGLGSDRRGTG